MSLEYGRFLGKWCAKNSASDDSPKITISSIWKLKSSYKLCGIQNYICLHWLMRYNFMPQWHMGKGIPFLF